MDLAAHATGYVSEANLVLQDIVIKSDRYVITESQSTSRVRTADTSIKAATADMVAGSYRYFNGWKRLRFGLRGIVARSQFVADCGEVVLRAHVVKMVFG